MASAYSLAPTFGVGYISLLPSGSPNVGGQIWTYAAGTTTPIATYTGPTGSAELPNPIVLDSTGKVPSGQIWFANGVAYKFMLMDRYGNVIQTYDNLSTAVATFTKPSITCSVTPAQFDNSLLCASTAFVQRAIGNFTSVAAVFSGAISVSQLGQAIQLAGNVTLPTGLGLAQDGGVLYLYNEGNTTYTVTVGNTSTDFIYWWGGGDSRTLRTITLNQGDTALLVNRGGVEWDLIGGSLSLINCAVLNNASVAFATNATNATNAATVTSHVSYKEIFTASGTFTVPANFVSTSVLQITALGAGGGGGSTSNSGAAQANGGAAGGICISRYTGLPAGEVLTFSLGGGGSAAVSSNGTTGGTTTVSGSGITSMFAYGGDGGSGVPSTIGDAGGGQSVTNFFGIQGDPAQNVTNVASSTGPICSNGASSPYGAGGVSNINGVGSSGGFGAGGGGSYTSVGGNGGNGLVIMEWWI